MFVLFCFPSTSVGLFGYYCLLGQFVQLVPSNTNLGMKQWKALWVQKAAGMPDCWDAYSIRGVRRMHWKIDHCWVIIYWCSFLWRGIDGLILSCFLCLFFSSAICCLGKTKRVGKPTWSHLLKRMPCFSNGLNTKEKSLIYPEHTGMAALVFALGFWVVYCHVQDWRNLSEQWCMKSQNLSCRLKEKKRNLNSYLKKKKKRKRKVNGWSWP